MDNETMSPELKAIADWKPEPFVPMEVQVEDFCNEVPPCNEEILQVVTKHLSQRTPYSCAAGLGFLALHWEPKREFLKHEVVFDFLLNYEKQPTHKANQWAKNLSEKDRKRIVLSALDRADCLLERLTRDSSGQEWWPAELLAEQREELNCVAKLLNEPVLNDWLTVVDEAASKLNLKIPSTPITDLVSITDFDCWWACNT